MSTTFERRHLTEALRVALTAVQVGDPAHPGSSLDALVGVGSMPADSGWHGEPNAAGSFFVPYFVLTTLTATPATDTGSLANPQQDWHIPYAVQSFGVSHAQAEWMADRGRIAVASLKNQILQCGESKYKVQQVWTAQIGAVSRVPQSDPPFYGQQDGATLWMAKRRTP